MNTKNNKIKSFNLLGITIGLVLGGFVINIAVYLIGEANCQMDGLSVQCNLAALLMQFEFFKLIFTVLEYCFGGTSIEPFLKEHTSTALLLTASLMVIAGLLIVTKIVEVILEHWKSADKIVLSK